MYHLCPVCFWEDDPHQAEQPDESDGANGLILTKARATYRRIGAISPEFLSKVRSPMTNELRE